MDWYLDIDNIDLKKLDIFYFPRNIESIYFRVMRKSYGNYYKELYKDPSLISISNIVHRDAEYRANIIKYLWLSGQINNEIELGLVEYKYDIPVIGDRLIFVLKRSRYD